MVSKGTGKAVGIDDYPIYLNSTLTSQEESFSPEEMDSYNDLRSDYEFDYDSESELLKANLENLQRMREQYGDEYPNLSRAIELHEEQLADIEVLERNMVDLAKHLAKHPEDINNQDNELYKALNESQRIRLDLMDELYDTGHFYV